MHYRSSPMSHTLTHHVPGLSAGGHVPDVPQQVAQVGVELAEDVILSFTLTGSDQFVHQDAELLKPQAT